MLHQFKPEEKKAILDDLKRGKTPILIVNYKGYVYVSRPAVENDRVNSKFIPITNTAYKTKEKAEAELRKLINRGMYTIYDPAIYNEFLKKVKYLKYWYRLKFWVNVFVFRIKKLFKHEKK